MNHYTFAQTRKSWTSLVGTILTLIVPWALQISQMLPPPWPAAVAGIMAILTALGVYKVPNAPISSRTQSAYPSPAYPSPVQDYSGNDFPWPKG
jgi:hypothetical protein